MKYLTTWKYTGKYIQENAWIQHRSNRNHIQWQSQRLKKMGCYDYWGDGERKKKTKQGKVKQQEFGLRAEMVQLKLTNRSISEMFRWDERGDVWCKAPRDTAALHWGCCDATADSTCHVLLPVYYELGSPGSLLLWQEYTQVPTDMLNGVKDGIL